MNGEIVSLDTTRTQKRLEQTINNATRYIEIALRDAEEWDEPITYRDLECVYEILKGEENVK